ncbi:recombinase family protein [Geodermatophilus sp. DSM 45219]|uniref:recombinase family protein n=1 Tax=Geodermatophilus sp. DSM 45219 TaxID=1881103 RepID=UPI0021019526|nr:recombinase family protein [Geodermatophilus sp. DSM 45219]
MIGYARVSTDAQDLTAQRERLVALGVDLSRIYVDHGLTGTNRERPGCVRRWLPAEGATPWWSPSRPAGPLAAGARAIPEELTRR